MNAKPLGFHQKEIESGFTSGEDRLDRSPTGWSLPPGRILWDVEVQCLPRDPIHGSVAANAFATATPQLHQGNTLEADALLGSDLGVATKPRRSFKNSPQGLAPFLCRMFPC